MKKANKFVCYEVGFGNIFAGLGLENVEALNIRLGLVLVIARAIRRLGLTRTEEAARMGISQAKVSGLLRGDFTNLAEQKLMGCRSSLGYDIAIWIKAARNETGFRRLAVA